MSTWKCEVVKIDNVENHPNADRLSIITIRGYQCISAKLEDGSHRYKTGDLVVYIPEASIIPQWILEKMGFWDKDNNCGTLSGSQKNRVKAIKLRGTVSQGILYGLRFGEPGQRWFLETKPDATLPHTEMEIFEGEDVATVLGITKYEPTVPISMRGVMGALYGITMKFDIDSIQNNLNVFTETDRVVVTEKLHGTCGQFLLVRNTELTEAQIEMGFKINESWSAFATSKGLGAKGFIQKNTEDNQDNIYIKVLKEYFIDSGVFAKIVDSDDIFNTSKYNKFVFLGEIVGQGVQDLSYGHTKTQFRCFDIAINDKFVDADELVYLCETTKIPMVPILYDGRWDKEEIQKLRDGKTIEGNEKHIREGIVIKSYHEEEYNGLPNNRKMLKWVSPDYLLRKDGTEYQ